MTNTAAALEQALKWHLAGDLARAQEAYCQILAADPLNPDAWHRLGVVVQQLGQADAATSYVQRAIRIAPQRAEFYLTWGEFQLARHDVGQAEAAFRTAISLQPACCEAYVGLGKCHEQDHPGQPAISWYRQAVEVGPQNFIALGHLAEGLLTSGQALEAIPYYREIVRLKPDFLPALNNLGVAYRLSGQTDEALQTFRRLLPAAPGNAEVHNNFGNVCEDLGEWAVAESHYAQAALLDPAYAVAHGNLAGAWRRLGRLDEALERCRHALTLAPRHRSLWNSLGAILQDMGRLEEARAAYDQAIEIDPGYAEAWNNLSNVLQGQQHLPEALAAANRALDIAPQHPDIHCNRALIWLLAGNYAAGWSEYEWRLRRPAAGPAWEQPAWDGQPLDERTILLHAEQGLGDTLQFVRYAPLVAARGGRVLLRCQQPLVSLLARNPGIAAIYAGDDALPEFDVQASLLSLPAIFNTGQDSIPGEIPYVAPAPARIRAWRDALPPRPGLRVGIAWQGNAKNVRDRMRSIPLSCFARLAEVPGVQLVSLQVGAGREQLETWTGSKPIFDLADRLVDFDDTAALVANLDLVITCDSACGHLAGALGQSVWIALPACPDWRWMLGRDDSPWYPTVRLFRQQRLGDWEPVFVALASELARRAEDKMRGR